MKWIDLGMATTLAVFAVTLPSEAQTVLNPAKAVFTASADHNVTVGGVALVEKYELRHYAGTATTPTRVDNLGKPTPDGTNTITVTFAPLPFSATTQYTAKVFAIGPTGEGGSAPSNPFYVVGSPAAPASVAVTK